MGGSGRSSRWLGAFFCTLVLLSAVAAPLVLPGCGTVGVVAIGIAAGSGGGGGGAADHDVKVIDLTEPPLPPDPDLEKLDIQQDTWGTIANLHGLEGSLSLPDAQLRVLPYWGALQVLDDTAVTHGVNAMPWLRAADTVQLDISSNVEPIIGGFVTLPISPTSTARIDLDGQPPVVFRVSGAIDTTLQPVPTGATGTVSGAHLTLVRDNGDPLSLVSLVLVDSADAFPSTVSLAPDPGNPSIYRGTMRLILQSQAGTPGDPIVAVTLPLAAPSSLGSLQITTEGQSVPGDRIFPTLVTLADPHADCNNNGQEDGPEVASHLAEDCNLNGRPDVCDIDDERSSDCNQNGRPDACELFERTQGDTNMNGVLEPACEIVDCNEDGTNDFAQLAALDQNHNGFLDGCESDCNGNAIPDFADVGRYTSSDCNHNVIPDECEPDADGDDSIDVCDGCPNDPAKDSPGTCGCGLSDVDLDGDGFERCEDCDDSNSDVHSLPGEAVSLHVSKGPGPGTITLTWDPPVQSGGNHVRYDAIMSATPNGFMTGDCVASDVDDPYAEDATVLGPGQVRFLEVRAQNDCGEGPLGTASSGTPRVGRSCPDCVDGMACEDGSFCTVGETCHLGVCNGGTPRACTDGNACTIDLCDDVANACVHDAARMNGEACDDGAFCTLDTTCSSGLCGGGRPGTCPPGPSCTVVTCDELGDSCNYDPAPADEACDDGDFCSSGDTCDGGGQCVGQFETCDDANDCTTDGCSAAGRTCSHGLAANGTACDDHQFCTEGTQCSQGSCQGGSPRSCDDANDCTADSCAAGSCGHAPLPDGTPTSCGVGGCAQTGQCIAGLDSCSPGTPTAETCDGTDEDCDSVIDDGFGIGQTCDGVGACGAGTRECASIVSTRCSTDPGGSSDQSQPETCDGADEDCNGAVDDGAVSFAAPRLLGVFGLSQTPALPSVVSSTAQVEGRVRVRNAYTWAPTPPGEIYESIVGAGGVLIDTSIPSQRHIPLIAPINIAGIATPDLYVSIDGFVTPHEADATNPAFRTSPTICTSPSNLGEVAAEFPFYQNSLSAAFGCYAPSTSACGPDSGVYVRANGTSLTVEWHLVLDAATSSCRSFELELADLGAGSRISKVTWDLGTFSPGSAPIVGIIGGEDGGCVQSAPPSPVIQPGRVGQVATSGNEPVTIGVAPGVVLLPDLATIPFTPTATASFPMYDFAFAPPAAPGPYTLRFSLTNAPCTPSNPGDCQAVYLRIVDPNGATCGSDEQCASGDCVDGYCCDSACEGACRSCSQPGQQGTCVNYPSNTDPENGCSGFTCDGSGSCRETCSSDGQCALGHYCGAGICSPQGGPGATCSGDNQCQSNHCVGGFCCGTAACGDGETCAAGACQCGTGGACAAGQRCLGGACVCDGTSCPTGCCAGDACTSPSPSSCGTNGSACTACGPTADACTGGQCRCGPSGACVAGQVCVGGSCVCNSASCPNGCCEGNVCTSPSPSSCGTNGNACTACGITADTCTGGQCQCGFSGACAAGQACVGGACVCNAASCPGGCCAGAVCQAPSDSTCGTGGGACAACQPYACDGSACNTTCTSNAQCAAGYGCKLGQCVSLDAVAVRVDSAGAPLDPSGIPVSALAYDQHETAVATDGNNSLIAWTDGRNKVATGRDEVRVARMDAGGVVLDTSGIWVGSTPGDQSQPSVAHSGGVYLVAFTTNMAGTRRVFLVRVSSAGTLLAPPAQMTIGPGEQFHPRVARMGTGWVVVFQDTRTGQSDIYARRVSSTGTLLGVEIAVSTAPFDQSDPAVAFDGASTWLVVWSDGRSGTGTDIYGSRVTTTGNVLDPAGIPINTQPGQQKHPAVAFRPGGGYLVVWDDDHLGPQDILGARVSTSGAVADPSGIVISSAPQAQSAPSLATDGAFFFIVWADFRSLVDFNVFGARFDPLSGTVLDPGGLPVAHRPKDQSEPAVAFGPGVYVVTDSEEAP